MRGSSCSLTTASSGRRLLSFLRTFLLDSLGGAFGTRGFRRLRGILGTVSSGLVVKLLGAP